MRFSGFDSATNQLLYAAYDAAMFSLSTDPRLSLDLIYRAQNRVAQRLIELAVRGEREIEVLKREAVLVGGCERRSHEMRAANDNQAELMFIYPGSPTNLGTKVPPE